jgi:3-isopropylmalate/(R)-2-methylmalate dehydratase small subunit
MRKIRHIEGVCAPLLVDNVSTDVISPSSLLGSINVDLAKGLFAPWRYLPDGGDDAAFALNMPRFREAKVLLTGQNFGCGSSREHAVWCLLRYGIDCVIAPSFGEIFLDNASKNALVAITLDDASFCRLRDEVDDEAMSPRVSVDIEKRLITSPSGAQLGFPLEDFRRTALLEGLDDIDLALREDAAIERYQQRARAEQPWCLKPLQVETAPSAKNGGGR